MRKFSKKVDLRSRRKMAEFLAGHFRYWTGNSWNRLDSYAQDMKVFHAGLDSDTEDTLFALLNTDDYGDFWPNIRFLTQEFAEKHGYRWQALWNGRSGGYLVLYQGGQKDSGYKSRCTECGQLNWQPVTEGNCRCGRCGKDTRVDLATPYMTTFWTMAGTDTGMTEADDFEDWDMERLRERVRLVQDFDRPCDDIAEYAVRMAEEYDVIEEEYEATEVRTRTVMVPRAAAM